MKALPFIHQPDRVARKASDVSIADWRYQTHIKKNIVFFHSCVMLRLFSGLEIFVWNPCSYDGRHYLALEMLYNCILFLRGLFLFSSSGLLGYSSGSSGQQGIIKTYIDLILIYHEADISIFYLSQVCLKWSALIKFNRTSFALHRPAMLC